MRVVRGRPVNRVDKIRFRKELIKEARIARAERKWLRVQKRKAHREAKAAPRRALAEWSEEVRSCGKCAVCGRRPVMIEKVNKKGVTRKAWEWVLNAHHLLPKERYKSLRTNPMNGICLCPTCHKYGKKSFHRNPIWAVRWLMRYRPGQYKWCIKHLDDE